MEEEDENDGGPTDEHYDRVFQEHCLVGYFHIDYSKGAVEGGRQTELNQQDTTEIVKYEIVRDMLLKIYHDQGPHKLTTALVASCSMFIWSLAHQHRNEKPWPSAAAILRGLDPTLDWSHLERSGRQRLKSEKAIENERHAKGKNCEEGP